jgi:uncharacterized membrane protein YeaQ/YmgE (transglycosylase-associated protein family)
VGQPFITEGAGTWMAVCTPCTHGEAGGTQQANSLRAHLPGIPLATSVRMTISLTGLIVLILIAAICGAIGRAIAGGVRGGLVTSIALGFIGALLGPWVAVQLKLGEPLMVNVGGHPFGILWSIIGAALFVAIIHLVSRR